MTSFVFRQKGRRIWRGRYRLDGETKIKEVSLHTCDKRVAEQRLRILVAELEQESAGLLPPKPLRDAAVRRLADHFEDYVADLNRVGRDSMYVYNVDKLITRLLTECHWTYPKDITPDSFQTWRRYQDKAAKTLNEYLATMTAFLKLSGEWRHAVRKGVNAGP